MILGWITYYCMIEGLYVKNVHSTKERFLQNFEEMFPLHL